MKRFLIVLMSICLTLVACSTFPFAPTGVPNDLFSLANTKWSLVSLTLDGVTQTPNQSVIPTLDFSADGQVGGTGGCNNFSGSFTTQGEILTIREIRMTVMACAPDEIMTLETAYMSALESARMFEKRDNQLAITFAEGKDSSKNKLDTFRKSHRSTLLGFAVMRVV